MQVVGWLKSAPQDYLTMGAIAVAKAALIPAERIERSILLIRGQKVLLDSDLAELYGVETKQLVRQVKRNRKRFPDEFSFQLMREEVANLRRQFGTSSSWGGRRSLPYAFTEQGVAMLSGVLHSGRAIEVNIAIMRAYVRLREILATNKELAAKLAEHDKKLGDHDEKFQIVFEAIRQLMAPPPAPKRRRIGFAAELDDAAAAQPEQAKRKRNAKIPQG